MRVDFPAGVLLRRIRQQYLSVYEIFQPRCHRTRHKTQFIKGVRMVGRLSAEGVSMLDRHLQFEPFYKVFDARNGCPKETNHLLVNYIELPLCNAQVGWLI